MAMRRYSNLLLNRCRRLRPCVEVWKMFYTLMYLIWRPIPSVKTAIVSGSLIDEEEHQIIGTLSDDEAHVALIVAAICRFIHELTDIIAEIFKQKSGKLLKMCVSIIHRRYSITCKPPTIHLPKSALS